MQSSRILSLAFIILVASAVTHSQSSKEPRLPDEERQALVSLYQATDGAHWIDNSGWLGPSGTECDWFGVICVYQGISESRHATVTSLSLSENGLKGGIPSQLANLNNLEWLTIFGNKPEGSIPEPLIRKFLRGPLDIAAEAHLLTDTLQVDYSRNSPSVLCAWRRVLLKVDGKATSYEIKCRNATPQDRSTFCEIKEGTVSYRDFARLGWALKDSGFFELAQTYSRSMTHGIDQKIRVTRGGKDFAVENYAQAGPLELWIILRTIEGIAATAEWEEVRHEETCPE